MKNELNDDIESRVRQVLSEYQVTKKPPVATSKDKGSASSRKRKNHTEDGEANPSIAPIPHKLDVLSFDFREIGYSESTPMMDPDQFNLDTAQPSFCDLFGYRLFLQTEDSKIFHCPIVVPSTDAENDWIDAQFIQLIGDAKKGVSKYEYLSFIIDDEPSKEDEPSKKDEPSSKNILIISYYQNDTVSAFISGDKTMMDRAKKHESLIQRFTKCFFNNHVKKTIQVDSVKFRDFGDLGLTCSAIRSRHLSPRITPPSVFSEHVRLLAFGDAVSVCGSSCDDLRLPNAFVSGDYLQQVMNEVLQSPTKSSEEILREISNLIIAIWYIMFFEVIFKVDIVNSLPDVTSRSSTKITSSIFYRLFQQVQDKFGSCEFLVFLYIFNSLSLTQFFLFSEKGLLHPRIGTSISSPCLYPRFGTS